jgi:hypothetical protein
MDRMSKNMAKTIKDNLVGKMKSTHNQIARGTRPGASCEKVTYNNISHSYEQFLNLLSNNAIHSSTRM